MEEDHDIKTVNKQKYLSYLAALLSCIFWTSGYIYSNNNNISVCETSMLRGCMLAIGCYGICKYQGDKMDFKNNFWLIIARNVLMVFNGMFVAFAQFYLPLSVVHSLGGTGTIFLLGLEYLYEGKKVSRNQGIGIIITIVGVILISNGRLILSHFSEDEFESDFENYRTDNPLVITIFCILMICNQILWAISVLMTKMLRCSTMEINFHFGVMLLVANAILFQGLDTKVPASTFYPGIFWTGICLFLAEVAFVTGIMMSVHTGITMMICQFTIVMGYLYSILLYN